LPVRLPPNSSIARTGLHVSLLLVIIVTQHVAGLVNEMELAAGEAWRFVVEPDLDIDACVRAGVQNDCHAAFMTNAPAREYDLAQIVNASSGKWVNNSFGSLSCKSSLHALEPLVGPNCRG
jgi:hypothetical protein